MQSLPATLPPCPDRLSDAQVEQYWREGYLAFEEALSAEEVEQAREALIDIIQRNAFDRSRCDFHPSVPDQPAHYAGAIYNVRGSRCAFQLEPGQQPAGDAEGIENQIRKFMWFETEAPIFAEFCSSHPRTFGLAEQLLGGKSRLHQSMALIKPPYHGTEKPWHQDNAYFSIADLNGVIGTWIALDNVDAENGCMYVLPGRHKFGPLRHHHTVDCEIAPGRLNPEEAVPLPMRAGGMMFFHSNLPHRTPPNRSPRRRRALQFHYRRADNPDVPTEAYDRIFAEPDGTPATCAAARRAGF